MGGAINRVSKKTFSLLDLANRQEPVKPTGLEAEILKQLGVFFNLNKDVYNAECVRDKPIIEGPTHLYVCFLLWLFMKANQEELVKNPLRRKMLESFDSFVKDFIAYSVSVPPASVGFTAFEEPPIGIVNYAGRLKPAPIK